MTEFKPRTITLYTDDRARAESIDNLNEFVMGLPLDKVFHAKINQGEEGRRDVANRLYNLVIGQVSKQIKSRPTTQHDYEYDHSTIAGKLKYHILLPAKPVWAAEFDDDKLRDEYELERELCDMIAASDNIDESDLYKAYDRAIRSKTLKVKPFARYLNELINKLTMQGFVIHLRASEKERVLGGELMGEVA